MAPKRKSTLSWNPLRSKEFTASDPTPPSVWFRDDKAWQDFSENFSTRGVYLECQVILSDYFDSNLPTVIHSRGWESLCDVSITCPFVLIQEFYSNMYGFDYSVPLFVTRVRGMRVVFTPDIVSDVFHIPKVAYLDYLVVSALGLCPKMSLYLLFVSVPLIGVIISSLLVRPFLKGLSFLTWL